MKATFYVVAILAACAAAFFSFNQSSKFQDITKVYENTMADHTEKKANLSATEKNITDEKALLAASKEKEELLNQSVSALKAKESAIKSETLKLDNELKAQAAEFAQLENALAQVQNALKGLDNVDLDNLADKIKEIDDDKVTKEKKLEELTTLAAGAEKTIAASRSDLDRLAKKMIERNSRIGRNSMEAVVTAVNQDWGFLVIGAGSNSGFTPQTALLVERDGQKIGRVRPSSIEPTQTIAEIDLESLSAGVRLQPGDRVILAQPASN